MEKDSVVSTLVTEEKEQLFEMMKAYSSVFIKEYDIENEFLWIVGWILLHSKESTIDNIANLFNVPTKKKWSKNKKLKKTLGKIDMALKSSDAITAVHTRLVLVISFFGETLHKVCNGTVTSKELKKNHDLVQAAVILRHAGLIKDDSSDYEAFLKKHSSQIQKKVSEIKRELLPYMEDSPLSDEVFRLRQDIKKLEGEKKKQNKKLLKESQKNKQLTEEIKYKQNKYLEEEKKKLKDSQNKVQELEKKNRKLKTTIETMEKDKHDNHAFPKAFVVQYNSGSGAVVLTEKTIDVNYDFLLSNQLLNGDIVEVVSETPLNVRVVNPSRDRKTTKTRIQVQDNLYVAKTKEGENICVGKTNFFLPEGVYAQVTYTDFGFGIVDCTYTQTQKEAKEKKEYLKESNPDYKTVYIIGGIKESYYKDIVTQDLIWDSKEEMRGNVIQANVQKADIVFIITAHISHVAYNVAKDYCKFFNTPVVFVNTTGSSGFEKIYQEAMSENDCNLDLATMCTVSTTRG